MKVVVIGSSNIDMVAQVSHLPAPGETVGDANFMQSLGGKGANQAVAAARLGGFVTFVTSLGNDMYADILKKQMEAVEKALTLSKDKCQKLFESSITTFQGYLDDANLCITNCGTRSSKLELIENRMKSQKTTFETLKSENEDIDVTETAINLKSAEMTYEAALMATGKVMQTTLLNFI